MKKTISRLPDSELDIMLVLWNHEPPMGRLEIERVVNEKKKLAPTTILSLLTRLEKKGFVSAKKEGKMNLYTPLMNTGRNTSSRRAEAYWRSFTAIL